MHASSWKVMTWSPGAFVLGLAESFLCDAYAGLVFTPIHNAFVRRFGTTARE